ncbi:septum formation protein Maf [Maribacter sp. MJ134]|uniref:Maf-like protein n=1 Tax=Maribacter sp. MJ134 TaxID=2496865 RepID=UPI000F8243DC|nr:Maf-like protein [Maribacter sp. MJ134]AZQ58262.1 septum formation protein Maf [Maribacter sp. MJ134]
MLRNILKDHKLILASGSPRRKMFFEEMGLDFEIQLRPVEEIYPEHLKGAEISDYLAALKASVFKDDLNPKEILITSDTVVWHDNESLAKAATPKEAFEMLKKLSDDWHQVITSVCFTTTDSQKVFNRITSVKFRELDDDEINYYITNYKPFDKAGAYGIQEWIGLVGIEEIKGSYTNVVGLPTQLVYKTLMHMVS